MLFRLTDSSLSVLAPAKLNLFLEILGKRADGFHEVETLMVSIGLYDTLTFFPTDDPELSLSIDGGPVDLASGPDNLVIRAARLLRERAGVEQGARIHLRKRIPVAAGLAGGSSDAAATLAGLNRLWGLGLSRQTLMEFAGELGSDIGFFLAEQPVAVCRGRGERVEPVRVPQSLSFVVARPDSGLATAAVYREYRAGTASRSASAMVAALRRGRITAAVHDLHNALQPPALRLNPDVAEMRCRFEKLPVLGHMMSGSGTAYFGICQTLRQARQVAGRLRNQDVKHVFVARSQP